MIQKNQPKLITIKVVEAEKEWFSMSEASKYTGIAIRTLRTLRSTGRLKFFSLEPDNIHARVYMRKRDLDKLFKAVV